MACNKNSYENEGLAEVAADYVNSKEGRIIVTTYRCDICLDWHLTSVN